MSSSQFMGFKDSYVDDSEGVLNIKQENIDTFLSGSLDIKKQLSQSFSGGGNQSHSLGISKPHSRRNSAYVKSHENSDDNDDNEGDDDKDTGNERKRRDNINEKIQELLTLIPQDFFQTGSKDSVSSSKKIKKEKSPSVEEDEKLIGSRDGKPNKGQILTKSVEYLQYLQNSIDENNRKEVELVMKLKNLEMKYKQKQGEQGSNVPIRVGYTSAEKALGEIGVGPCSENYFKTVLVNSANSSKSGRRGSTL